MAKKKIKIEIDSFGIYTHWDRNSKKLPKPLKFTTEIPAELDIEFGMILQISSGKGEKLDFCIKHPPIKDEKGQLMPHFTGEYYINSNDFKLFIGDTIWEPIDEKKGKWEVMVYYKGDIVANKIFNLV